jgi:hypothetical protein
MPTITKNARASTLTDGWLVHKFANRFGRHQHDTYRGNHGRHHDADLVYHAHRRNDGVQREHNVDDSNLGNDGPEQPGTGSLYRGGVRGGGGVLLVCFHFRKNFVRGFVQQEHSAQQQHDVASAKAFAGHAEQVAGQTHHPAQRKQQRQA